MRRYFISAVFFILAAVLLAAHIYCEACAASLVDVDGMLQEVTVAIEWLNLGNIAMLTSFVCLLVAALKFPKLRAWEKAAFVVGVMFAYDLVSLLLTMLIVY